MFDNESVRQLLSRWPKRRSGDSRWVYEGPKLPGFPRGCADQHEDVEKWLVTLHGRLIMEDKIHYNPFFHEAGKYGLDIVVKLIEIVTEWSRFPVHKDGTVKCGWDGGGIHIVYMNAWRTCLILLVHIYDDFKGLKVVLRPEAVAVASYSKCDAAVKHLINRSTKLPNTDSTADSRRVLKRFADHARGWPLLKHYDRDKDVGNEGDEASDEDDDMDRELAGFFMTAGLNAKIGNDSKVAEENFREALQIIEKGTPNGHPDFAYTVFDVIDNICICQLELGMYDEVLANLLPLLDDEPIPISSEPSSFREQNRCNDSENASVASFYPNTHFNRRDKLRTRFLVALAYFQKGKGNKAKAEENALLALKGMRKLYSKSDRRFVETVELIVDIYMSMAKPVKANAYRQFLHPLTVLPERDRPSTVTERMYKPDRS